MDKRRILILISMTILFVLSCNFMSQQLAPASTKVPTSIATKVLEATTIVEPTSSPRLDLPRDENAVPRISVEQAKAALDSGAAVIVDVRPEQSYALEHIAGSISIPLSEIENDPAGVKLDKKQWIITYCT